jgi:hypothetical protein
MARRLQNVVAGRKAVRASGKKATHRRSIDGRMGVNHFEGDPNGLVVDQVTPFHPQHRRIGVEAAVGHPRQEIDVSGFRFPAQFSVARKTDRQLNVFGVPRLQRFHQTGGLGRREADPLAMKYGGRPRVRPAHHHDRYSSSVQSRKISDPSDAKTGLERQYSRQRLLRR